MRPPAFWHQDGVIPRLLAPASLIVSTATARRVARPGWRAPIPVLCIGNAGVGGAGKTPVVLDLAARLQRRGIDVHCLTRGYGGQVRGPHRVDPAIDSAAQVGDEPLLLTQAAPTWIGADRAASAQAAAASGAAFLLMDDGLQNPTLHKDASLLVVDGGYGFGNCRVLPAGPLREPVAAAAARCRAAVLIGPDRAGIRAALPPALPVFPAHLVPGARHDGQLLLAFAGIGRPEKFFDSLREAGATLVGQRGFPDHHPYTAAELDALLAEAHGLDATPITTAKDAIRLPPLAPRPDRHVNHYPGMGQPCPD